MAYFKYRAAKAINLIRQSPSSPVWQRNYYEHLIRNDQELERIRVYIQENPAKWQEDEDNPMNLL